MKKLIIIAMACYGLSARAQLRESRDFLYLFSDSIIYANDIQFRPDFSGNLRLRVDARNVPIGQVKFLNSKEGFFANTRKMGTMRVEEFAERIIAGRINIFQERPLSYFSAPVVSSNGNRYYNKGYTDLKRLNYANLKRDMTDNPSSMDMLRAYRRGMNTTALLYVTGVASLLAAPFVGTSGNINSSDKNFTIGLGLGALGIGLITGGYLRTSSIKQRLENAVDIYNR